MGEKAKSYVQGRDFRIPAVGSAAAAKSPKRGISGSSKGLSSLSALISKADLKWPQFENQLIYKINLLLEEQDYNTSPYLRLTQTLSQLQSKNHFSKLLRKAYNGYHQLPAP